MKSISANLLKKAIKEEREDPSVLFINVCTPIEYEEEHIDGFESMPLDTIEKNIETLKNKKKIYVSCMSGLRSESAIERMREYGIDSEILHLEGGIESWVSSGFSVVSNKSSKMSVMRQVFLTAGLLVLLGIILTLVTENLNFLYISGFIGFGLTVSGLTGWCGLHYLLNRMPWNKINKC